MTASSPNRLSAFQQELLRAFFTHEQRLFLTGGGALAGFYFGHRDTEDLDLFTPPGLDLSEPAAALSMAASDCSATLESVRTFPDFRRYLARQGDAQCIVDLVIDRAPMIETEKNAFGEIRVDTQREIAANKICTLLSRSEIKDFVDLKVLVENGIDLARAFDDAQKKDRGAEPSTLAWILEQVTISPRAALPGGADPVALDAFRKELVLRLRRLAFDRVRP